MWNPPAAAEGYPLPLAPVLVDKHASTLNTKGSEVGVSSVGAAAKAAARVPLLWPLAELSAMAMAYQEVHLYTEVCVHEEE